MDAPRTRTWRPLFDPATAAPYVAIARALADGVRATPDATSSPVDVATDRALLFGYLAEARCVEDPDDVTGAAIVESVETLTAGPLAASLYGGAARVGFTVAHLAGGETADEVCEHVDRILVDWLETPQLDFDLVRGLVGVGIYALERMPSSSGERLALRVLDQLERLAEPHPTGLAWFTPAVLLPESHRSMFPDGYHNLGLAHGIPGVLALLARYRALDLAPARVDPLLEGGLSFLRAVAMPDGESRYPGYLPVPAHDQSRRVAWCYGDLGIGLALLQVAASTRDAATRAEAIDLLHGAAARPVERSHVLDGGLCHGAAGVAHLFNRAYQATGDETLGAAARRWFEHLVTLRRAEPIAGFPTLYVDDTGHRAEWRATTSLLEGAAGIALALLAATSELEPSWDRLLAVDVAPGACDHRLGEQPE